MQLDGQADERTLSFIRPHGEVYWESGEFFFKKKQAERWAVP
jgi:hypothetical protein